jgi:hypothetical protein
VADFVGAAIERRTRVDDRSQLVTDEHERSLSQARETLARLKGVKAREPDTVRDALERMRRQRVGSEPEPSPYKRNSAPDGLVYKTCESNAPAPAPEPDSDDQQQQIITTDILGEVIAQERKRYQAEIDALKDRVEDLKKAFFNLPAGLVEAVRDLRDDLAQARATLAEVRITTERERRSDPLDLPTFLRRERIN